MLTQDYSYYLFKVLLAGLPSISGILGAILLLAAVFSPLLFKSFKSGQKRLIFWGCILIALSLITLTFYNAVYEFDEKPQDLAVFDPLQDIEKCGSSHWTSWTKSGYGMNNPCPAGCYRGITLRKEMRMTGFPPWPEYRRELQCLVKDY